MMRSTISAWSLGLGVAALLAGAGTARSATFQYVVKHVPSDQGDCHQLASALGDQVHTVTGVKVRRAICTVANEYGYNFLVEYEADQKLELITTADPLAGIDSGGGIYETLAACRADLPAELARFKAATQLTPVISYCGIDPYSDQPYAIKIDAFGTPVAAPIVGDWNFFGLPIGITGPELEVAVRAGLTARGIDASYVKYKEAAYDGVLVAAFYASEPVSTRDLDVAYTDTAAQCLATVREARAVFRNFGDGGVLTTLCSYDQTLERYNVTTLTVNAAGLTATPAVERFAGFEACAGAKAELTRRYRDDIGRPVIGSVCGKARDDQWAVVLYEQY